MRQRLLGTGNSCRVRGEAVSDLIRLGDNDPTLEPHLQCSKFRGGISTSVVKGLPHLPPAPYRLGGYSPARLPPEPALIPVDRLASCIERTFLLGQPIDVPSCNPGCQHTCPARPARQLKLLQMGIARDKVQRQCFCQPLKLWGLVEHCRRETELGDIMANHRLWSSADRGKHCFGGFAALTEVRTAVSS
jgi:hypothetical protein